jgi:hypothetical protein
MDPKQSVGRTISKEEFNKINGSAPLFCALESLDGYCQLICGANRPRHFVSIRNFESYCAEKNNGHGMCRVLVPADAMVLVEENHFVSTLDLIIVSRRMSKQDMLKELFTNYARQPDTPLPNPPLGTPVADDKTGVKDKTGIKDKTGVKEVDPISGSGKVHWMDHFASVINEQPNKFDLWAEFADHMIRALDKNKPKDPSPEPEPEIQIHLQV